VNGKLTSTPGTFRRYVSRGLVPGYRYTYEIRAEYDQDGKTQTDTQVVHVRAGETTDLAFNFDPTAAQLAATPVNTTLTVHVPEGARVSLGGNDTVSSGTVRQFTTTDLSRDDAWKDYRVVVTLDRNGEELRREQTVTVKGGDIAIKAGSEGPLSWDLKGRDLSGPWGVGVQAGGAGIWHDVQIGAIGD
ncbi:MAG: TIGR03000 domain-containing protein, partial [bacterium]|nr:TIGR03000 domain-containing protein [bacterium]